MRIYVISLERSQTRRRRIAAALAERQLDFEFVDAVDGRALTSGQRRELIDQAAVDRYPNWLTDPVLGCTLSHRNAYERLMRSGARCACVLEDDAVIADDFPELLFSFESNAVPDEVIQLHVRSFKPCQLKTSTAVQLGRYRIMEAVDPRQVISSVGYVIGVDAATRLHRSMVPVAVSADSWGHHIEHGDLAKIRCVLPRPVSHLDVESTHGYSDNSRLLRTLKKSGSAPVEILRQLNRRRITHQMTRVKLVD